MCLINPLAPTGSRKHRDPGRDESVSFDEAPGSRAGDTEKESCLFPWKVGFLREGVRWVRDDKDQAGLSIRAIGSSVEPLELTLCPDVTTEQQRKGICV